MFRGETVGRFTLVRPLYRRDVFQARDGRRHVALALINTERSQLRRAVEIACKLEHPNLCRVRELVETPEQCAIVMDLIDGATLSDRLLLGPLPSAQATSLIGQLLDGLACVHAAGLAHGSVTPQHAMIGTDGKLVLLDIGIRSGTITDDLERVGALAYALLTADTTGQITPSAAAPLARWIERCLAGEFADAVTARAALASPIAGRDSEPAIIIDKPAVPTAPPRRSRRPLIAALAAAAVVAIGVGILAANTGGRIIIEAPPPRVAIAERPARPINKYGRPPLPSGAVEPDQPPGTFSLAVHDPPKPIAKPAPTPIPLPRPTGATLGEVQFSAESTWIETPAIAVLDQVHRKLVANKQLRIQVVGHSSADGSDVKNRETSYARAVAVRNYFTSNGIDASRIDTVARGAESPIGSNDTADGRARNRRVEIRALDQR